MVKILAALLISAASCGQAEKKLVFEENFNGRTLDETVWNFELGDGCPNCGWGNAERQLYTKTNHEVANGHLTINATLENGKYTSSRLTTKGKKEFQYGRFEARAKLPVGTGIWPAFWMLGANISTVGWPKCGEIDILEYVGREPDMVFTSLHTQDSHGNTVNTKKTKFADIEEGFHIYAAEWDKDKIDFFVDGQKVYTFSPAVKNENTWPFDQPFYMIVNVAIGGNFGGPAVDDSIFPQQFVLDYIRVYQ